MTRLSQILAEQKEQQQSGLETFFGLGGQSAAPTPFVLPELDSSTTRLGQIMQRQSDIQTNISSPDTSYLDGFIESTLSSAVELFGHQPNERVEAFRIQNPISGFGSQLVSGVGVFGAAYKISKLPKMAAALEASMMRLGAVGDAAVHPIAAGALKETLRYAPLELSRLGVGTILADDMDGYGNLLADVGLSMAFTGGLGALGGFFRAGGTKTPAQGRVAGSDVGLLPTFEFRLGLDDAAQVTGDVSKRQVMHNLKQEALYGLPVGTKAKAGKLYYVRDLEGGDPQTAGLLNQLFNPQGSSLSQSALDKKLVDVRLLAEDVAENTRTVNVGEQARIAKQAGFSSVDEMVATLVYPRIATVNTERGAGWIGKMLDDVQGMQKVSDDMLLWKETDGLWVVAKRVERANRVSPDAKPFTRLKWMSENARKAKGPEEVEEVLAQQRAAIKNAGSAEEAKELQTALKKMERSVERNGQKRFGGQKIAEGDRWLIAKTDKPGKLAPEADKVLQGTVKQWAKMAEPFRPLAAADPFDRNMNAILQAVSPADWQAMAALNKAGWTKRMRQKLAKEANLANSQGVQDAADWLWDVFRPTLYKEQSNPMYARLYGLLRGTMDYADKRLGQIMSGNVRTKQGQSLFKAPLGSVEYQPGFNNFTPVKQLWASLDDAERQLVVRAAQSQTPADDLAKLAADGAISPRAQEVVKSLQDINEAVMNELVLPALKSAGLDGQVKLLEGYILPRIFKGDFFVEVKSANGELRWLAAGLNPKAAQREADQVIKEAAEKGEEWTRGEIRNFANVEEPDKLREISSMVDLAMGRSQESQEIIQSALRKIDAAKGGRMAQGRPGTPGTLSNKRTGVPGTPDSTKYSLEDVIGASEGHYRQLLRFAAYHSWNQRWMPLAMKELKASGKGLNQVEFDDLVRKSNQFLGIEGNITKTLNNVLKPVLGNTLGGKAATRIAQATNKLMYNWNLGIVNPTFAVLNLLTPLQTVAPWVSYVTRAPEADVARMMQFIPRYGSDGLPRESMGFLHPMKILGQAMKDMKNPSPQLRSMIDEAISDGTLAPQLVDEWIGKTSETFGTLNDAYKQKGGWGMIMEGMTWMATKSENFSRMTAFASAYRVGKDVFRLEGDQLYRFAKRGTNVTMYGYGVTDRARIMTGPVGSMFGLFKNWQFHFIGSMAQYAGVGMRDGVWAPMLWQGASALALGGLGATPLKLLADGLAKWNTDSPSSFHWLQENWSGAADEIYFGLPALLGTSLQSSAAIPGTDVRNELSSLGSFVFLERAKAVGKAVGDAWDYAEHNKQNPLKNPNIRDGLMGSLAPRAMFRTFASTEGDYIRSMRSGLPSVRDISPAGKIAYAMGMNPTEIEKWQVAGRELYKSQEAEREMISTLGKAYADAQLNRDWQGMQNVIDRSLAMGLPVSSVVQSGQTTVRREQGTNLDRYDKVKVYDYARALED